MSEPAGMFTNADVNKMTKAEIIQNLGRFNLSIWGKKDVIAKRLKDFCQKRRKLEVNRQLSKNKQKRYDRYYDVLCVLDFECTCVESREIDYPHEIIEFPVVMLSTSTLDVIDTFHAYCKPVVNPILTKFCVDLTGISQDDVDSAQPFSQVLEDFQEWLDKHSLGTELRYAIVADGPWDMGHFFQIQCQQSNLQIPHHLRYWINVRKHFVNFYRRNDPTYKGINLLSMLQSIGQGFDGRQHSGFDDARNICKIVIQLLKDGCDLRINERLVRRDVAVKHPTSEFVSYRGEPQDAKETKDEVKVVEDPEEEKLFSEVRLGSNIRNLFDKLSVGPGLRGDIVAASPTHSNTNFNAWKQSLPYKLVGITKPEFLRNMHLQCLTCSESETTDEEDT